MSRRAVLDVELPAGATGVVVGLSGGADSAALLAALARMRASGELEPALRAVHVNHGLQAAAVDFVRASAAQCRALDVSFRMLDAEVVSGGASIEAAARAARYAALAAELLPNECLLTAHHADDQAETVLLQLLRGAGLKGQSAMPRCRQLGLGWQVRPALQLSRGELHALGAAGPVSVPDPMNDDLRFDRNFVRAKLWPVLLSRWPGAAAALSRSAHHAAEAQSLLDEIARDDAQSLRDGDALSIVALRGLGRARRANALRFWLQAQNCEAPSTARLHEALRQMLDADPAKNPVVIWGHYALRRYRDRLCLTTAALPRLDDAQPWRVALDATLELGAGLGTLEWRMARGGLDPTRLPVEVTVRPRRGGETLRPAAAARTQTLQHLCQACGVYPWMRAALPLIFAGDQLLAVGDVWQEATCCVPLSEDGLAPFWRDAPKIL